MNISLYQINQQLIDQFEKVAELQGEITEQQEKDIETLNQMMSEKTDNCVDYLDSLNDLLDAVKTRIKEFQEAKKKIEARQERFKQYLENCLIASGKEKLEGETTYIKLRKKSVSCKIIDEDKIPLEFLKTETVTKIDVAGIKKVLESGEEVAGAVLEISQKPSLVINKGK